jgi:CheY-like chemotaxis protein
MFGVWEILTELRSRPITSTMPIIVSTTDPFLTQEHLDGFQALHAIVIDKPFEIETVIETVTQVLEGQ